MNIYWDIETFSQCNPKDYGAHRYATDPSTGIYFFCFASDDGEVQVWRPSDPVPEPFANPTGHLFISDNWEFERAIHTHILVKHYGFPPIPIETKTARSVARWRTHIRQSLGCAAKRSVCRIARIPKRAKRCYASRGHRLRKSDGSRSTLPLVSTISHCYSGAANPM